MEYIELAVELNDYKTFVDFCEMFLHPHRADEAFEMACEHRRFDMMRYILTEFDGFIVKDDVRDSVEDAMGSCPPRIDDVRFIRDAFSDGSA